MCIVMNPSGSDLVGKQIIHLLREVVSFALSVAKNHETS